MIFAKNKKRVSAIYRAALGPAPSEEAPSRDVLQGLGIELAIHAIPRKIAATIAITKPPQVREDRPFKPAFHVADLDAVRAAAAGAGGFLKPLDTAWQIRGATVLDGWDPEGNVVQFKQRL